jgi:hypothetical protein
MNTVDFTTVVVVFFVTGFFLPVFIFLGPAAARSFASIERSEAFHFRVPSIMSVGSSPGLELGGIGVVVEPGNAT